MHKDVSLSDIIGFTASQIRQDLNNFGGFGQQGYGYNVEDLYNEMFGWGSMEEDSQNFDASLEYWGEQIETLQLVPEMSTGMMN